MIPSSFAFLFLPQFLYLLTYLPLYLTAKSYSSTFTFYELIPHHLSFLLLINETYFSSSLSSCPFYYSVLPTLVLSGQHFCSWSGGLISSRFSSSTGISDLTLYPDKCHASTSIWFTIHFALIILTLNVTGSQLLTTSLNNAYNGCHKGFSPIISLLTFIFKGITTTSLTSLYIFLHISVVVTVFLDRWQHYSWSQNGAETDVLLKHRAVMDFFIVACEKPICGHELLRRVYGWATVEGSAHEWLVRRIEEGEIGEQNFVKDGRVIALALKWFLTMFAGLMHQH